MEWKLSVDLDNVPYWKVLQTYFNMKYFFGEVRIFRTRKGYHFEADVPTSIEARLLLGDDDYRLWLSEVRSWVSGYLDDVTFDWKYENGKWRSREEIDEKTLLADEFWRPVGRIVKSKRRRC